MDLSILITLRKSKKITQKEMGKRLGCGQAYVSQVERGNRNDLRTIEKLCIELDCELRIIPKT